MLTRVCRAWEKVVRKNMNIKAKEDNKYGYSQWLKENGLHSGIAIPSKE